MVFPTAKRAHGGDINIIILRLLILKLPFVSNWFKSSRVFLNLAFRDSFDPVARAVLGATT